MVPYPGPDRGPRAPAATSRLASLSALTDGDVPDAPRDWLSHNTSRASPMARRISSDGEGLRDNNQSFTNTTVGTNNIVEFLGVAVDGAHVYWTTPNATVGRANVERTGVNHSFITAASNPQGVAVDGAHVYWTNFSADGTIGRANLDGTGVDQSFITGASFPGEVAVDALTPSGACLGRWATITATAGGGPRRGTPGNDVIVGSRGADRISSAGGSDLVCSRGGDDLVSTGAGADGVSAGSGDIGSGPAPAPAPTASTPAAAAIGAQPAPATTRSASPPPPATSLTAERATTAPSATGPTGCAAANGSAAASHRAQPRPPATAHGRAATTPVRLPPGSKSGRLAAQDRSACTPATPAARHRPLPTTPTAVSGAPPVAAPLPWLRAPRRSGPRRPVWTGCGVPGER